MTSIWGNQVKENRFPQSLSLFFLYTLFLAPFIFPYHTAPLPSFYTELLAILLLLGSLIFICFAFCVQVTLTSFFLFLFAIYLIATSADYLSVSYLLLAALALVAAASLRPTYEMIAQCLLIGAILNAVTVLIQWMLGQSPIGLLAQANNTANYITLGFFSTLFLFLRCKLTIQFSWFLGFLFLLVIIATGSRTAFLYFVVVSCVIYWSYFRKFTYILVMVAATSLLALVLVKHTDSVRLSLLNHGYEMFMSAPIFGSGSGSFIMATPDGMLANHAHNVFINVLAETGLFGFLILCLIIWSYLRQHDVLTLKRLYATSLLTVIAVHSFFEFPLWYANFLLITAMIVGISTKETFTVPLSKGLRYAFSLFLLVSTLYAFYHLYAYWKMEEAQRVQIPIDVKVTIRK